MTAADPAPGGLFQPGDRLLHPQLGKGTVLRAGRGILAIGWDKGTTTEIIETHPGLVRLTDWDEGRISPPWLEIADPERFMPPLTSGERELARFLDESLPAGWRIYVRPHLDADRPLLAALHPEAGGMLWDVVEWNLSEFEVKSGLWVNGERPFSSPYRFMNEVRRRLYAVYVPEIGETLNAEDRRFGVVRAAIYFPLATTEEALALANRDPASKKIWTFGKDTIERARTRDIVPILDQKGILPGSWFGDLDAALSHARRPPGIGGFELNPEQHRRATPKPGYTAIEGVAGSGKTLVLAHRAAAVASSGRNVLLLTYNRTLVNYLRGILRGVPYAYVPDRITVLNFHLLCRRIHDHHGIPLPSVRRNSDGDPSLDTDDDIDGQAVDVAWPASAERVIDTHGIPPALRFDAVLIDEGQDFTPAWLRLVGRLGPSEVVMAHDAAQHLYDREDALSNKEIAALFGTKANRPAPLGKAVRLPAQTVQLAADYAEHWGLQTPRLVPAEEGLLPPDASIEAVEAATPADAGAAVIGILRAWQAEPLYRPGIVAVVVPEKAFGSALVLHLAELGTSTNHVFPVANTGALMEEDGAGPERPPWLIGQANKTAFAFGDPRLKVSTIHSFKGWEAERVILVLPFDRPTPFTVGSVFVGLTRSRGQLVLVGRVREYGLGGLAEPAGGSAAIDQEVAHRFGDLLAEARTQKGRHGSPPRRSPVQPGPTLFDPEEWRFVDEWEH